MKILSACLAAFAILSIFNSYGDTPPPGVVGIKGATTGTPIGNVGDALKVYPIINPSGSPQPVVITGPSPLPVQVSNFPSPVATQSVSVVNQISAYALDATLQSILADLTNGNQKTQVTNFPATNACTQSGSWTIAVNNFPSTQPVSGTVSSHTQDGSGTAITSTLVGGKQGLDVNVIAGGGGGSSTVNQGTPAPIASAWPVVFPSAQPVTVSNTPTVVVSGVPTVQVSGTPTVAISGTPTVAISGTPTVAISGTPVVAVSGTPNVQVVNTSASPVPVAVVSPLPAGTNALGTVGVSNFPANQAINGPVSIASPLPAGTNNIGLVTIAGPSPLPVTISGTPTVQVSGTPTVQVSGTPTVQVSGTPTVNLSQVGGSSVALGQAAAASSFPTALANEDVQGKTVTGPTVTGTPANILTNSSTPTNVDGYKCAVIQLFGASSWNGSVNFQQSVDGTNGWASALNLPTGSFGVSYNNSGYNSLSGYSSYFVQIAQPYFRINDIFTTVGSIQATAFFMQSPCNIPAAQVTGVTGNVAVTQSSAPSLMMTPVQATAANLNMTAVQAAGSHIASAAPVPVNDVPSASISATATTTGFTPTYGNCYQINIPVTAVSGSPTMDVEVQESRDTAGNWVPIFDFPRISATGSYNSPQMLLTGNEIRYVQTIGGTTSFTRAINHLQSSPGTCFPVRQIIDRTITLTSLGSTTVNLQAEANTHNVMLTFNIGADTGLAPVLQLQGSDDGGSSTGWYPVGSTLTGVASSTVSITIPNVTSQLYRAIVSTAGVGVTPGYVVIRAF